MSQPEYPAMLKRFTLAFLLPVLAVAGGCGQAEEPKAAAPPPEHGIFISASDCADSGKLTLDQCAEAIDAAVASHEVQAPTYKSVGQCAGTMGPDRCDKGVDGLYRARVQAFYIIMGTPPSAVPLYPPTTPSIGFQSPSKQAIDARNENMHVSIAAQTIAHENAKLSAPDVDYATGLGAAAADIH